MTDNAFIREDTVISPFLSAIRSANSVTPSEVFLRG